MKGLLTCILALLCVSANADTVYKTVDENGNVIFTDQPSEGAEKIRLQELQTIENPNPAKYKPLPKQKPVDNDADFYQAFSVVKPADKEGYRNNAGNVTIQLSLQPALQQHHRVVIKMDGKEISRGRALSVSLENIDRGDHSISATVVDSDGNSLISTSSSFSMLRVSLGSP